LVSLGKGDFIDKVKSKKQTSKYTISLSFYTEHASERKVDIVLTNNRVPITGGAGFIGSHLIDVLITMEANIIILDNLSSGSLNNIKQHLDNQNLTFIHGDLLNPADVARAVDGCEIVYHLAANPEVRIGSISPDIHYKQNILATYNLLEAIRKAGTVNTLLFASSSTVYGEASKVPTPEDYAPLEPISVYGASKLACEALITAYAHTYGFKAIIYRLANIVGTRSKHGVIHDFIQKLKKNPKQLEILGDGTQSKSYLYVADCVEAMLLGLEKSSKSVEIYNVGSEDQITVKEIAKIITQEMGLKNVKFTYTGGVDGGRGWIGDVRNMLLDVNKLKSLGWKPEHNSKQAITKTIKELTRQQV